MTQDETLNYNSPHFTLVLLETDIPLIISMNKSMLGKNIGLYQLNNKEETMDAFEKGNDKLPVFLVKPTEDHFHKVFAVSSFYFLSGKIKLLMETTFYSN